MKIVRNACKNEKPDKSPPRAANFVELLFGFRIENIDESFSCDIACFSSGNKGLQIL